MEAQKAEPNSKVLLWLAVLGLMQKRYGRENLNRLSRESGIGPATASRIKAQETSVGLDTLDKLSEHFMVEPWHLLMPGFSADTPVLLPSASALAQDVALMLDNIKDEDKRRKVYALFVQMVEFGSARPAPAAAPSVSPTPELQTPQ